MDRFFQHFHFKIIYFKFLCRIIWMTEVFKFSHKIFVLKKWSLYSQKRKQYVKHCRLYLLQRVKQFQGIKILFCIFLHIPQCPESRNHSYILEIFVEDIICIKDSIGAVHSSVLISFEFLEKVIESKCFKNS